MLYSVADARQLLGTIMVQPTLITSGKYPLGRNDFSPNKFHQILFAVIYNLINNGAQNIDEVAVGTYIEPYEVQKEILQDNNYLEFISTVKQLANIENIEYYYNNVRKFSLLRAYEEQGFDITEIFDENKSEDKQRENLDKYKINDIINYFENKMVKVRKQFSTDNQINEIQAGENFEETKEMFKASPFFGSSFVSEYLNSATRGFIKGQLVCFSSATGVGKSTIGISTLVKICCPQLYDESLQKYIDNPCRTAKGALLIQFEMDNQLEIEPKFIANISNIPSEKILNGVYSDEEDKRLDKAAEILKESNIHIACMPNFTTTSIENCIKDYVTAFDIDFVVFDYLQEMSSINQEIAKSNNITTRGDMVLSALSSFLKEMARKYNVGVYTMSQCNASVTTQEVFDAGVIAGSRSAANKFDIGAVIMPPRKKELNACKDLIDKKGFGEKLKPTHIIHLYKVRFGKYEPNIKIWLNINMSTGRVTDLWTTTWDDEPYKLEKVKLEK